MAAMCIDLPDKIHERLRERAEADHRSMRKTIVVAVERFLDEERFKRGAVARTDPNGGSTKAAQKKSGRKQS